MGSIALYMRLSSEDSHSGESYSIGNQRDLLYDFIRNHREFDGRSVLEFCDDGYSGTNFERPGIKKLLALAGSTVDCIMVKDFSRFGRNLIDVGDYLDQIFPFLGVRFIAVNEGYDSAKSLGSAVSLDVSLKAMVYEMYSRDISEKIRCVQQAKMRKGEYLCGIAFYGYQKSATEKNKLVIDESAAKVVRRIFGLAAEGKALSEIAAILNHDGVLSPLMYRKENHTDGMRGWTAASGISYWTRETIKRIISDERYTGCLIFGRRRKVDVSTKRTEPVPKDEWIVVKNSQEAIVSRELFEQAQGILRHINRKKPAGKPQQKFRGILKCASCNRVLLQMGYKDSYFCCPYWKSRPDSPCAKIHLDKRDLERRLLEKVKAQVQSLGQTLVEKDKQEKQKGCNLKEAVRECQMEVSRWKVAQTAVFEDYAEGRMNKQEYLAQKREMAIWQEDAEKRYAELVEQMAVRAEQEQKESKLKVGDLGRFALAEEVTREMLEELIQVVKVSGKDELEIVWKENIKNQ